jgi:hypothetical protein
MARPEHDSISLDTPTQGRDGDPCNPPPVDRNEYDKVIEENTELRKKLAITQDDYEVACSTLNENEKKFNTRLKDLVEKIYKLSNREIDIPWYNEQTPLENISRAVTALCGALSDEAKKTSDYRGHSDYPY